jgi:hypothetical protein
MDRSHTGYLTLSFPVHVEVRQRQVEQTGPEAANIGHALLSFDPSHLELKFITSLWTKSADQILASVKRFRQKTQQTLCGEL